MVLNSSEIAVCDGVSKIYRSLGGDTHALVDVDARFMRGTLTALVGPSGSGKSSLLRLLAGLDRPSKGSVEVAGEWISGLRARRRRRMRRRLIGYVFQRPSDNLISYLTAVEHVSLAARLRGADPSGAAVLLSLLGIEHRRDNRPQEMSGGEQQRLAFAMAVVGSPALVVADEPTAELDSHAAEGIVEVMQTLAEGGTSVVASTHDLEVAEAAAHLIVLEQGRVAG